MSPTALARADMWAADHGAHPDAACPHPDHHRLAASWASVRRTARALEAELDAIPSDARGTAGRRRRGLAQALAAVQSDIARMTDDVLEAAR